MEEETITLEKKKSLREKISLFFSNPKKRLGFIIASGIVLIAAVGYGLYAMNKPADSIDSSTPKDQKQDKAVSTTKYYGMLDGVETDQDSSTKHPLAIMVENHIDARPQAGIDKASIVYEAIAEGGITRFLTLFATHEDDKVGPVRSARPYFVDWAMGYNAYYAHVGGNYNALQQIISEKVYDLDQFKYPGSYWRDTKLKVSKEHTVFASTIKLRQQASTLGYSTDNKFKVYKFAAADSSQISQTDQTATSSATVANQVNVNFSSANYNVAFRYDASKKNYKRVVNGSTQLDRESKAEIAPTNLIVMTVSRSELVTAINEKGWNMATVGEGNAKIFLDGKVVEAKWVKNSKNEREVFYDLNNQEITFNRGQFWICVIPPDSTVTYQ